MQIIKRVTQWVFKTNAFWSHLQTDQAIAQQVSSVFGLRDQSGTRPTPVPSSPPTSTPTPAPTIAVQSTREEPTLSPGQAKLIGS